MGGPTFPPRLDSWSGLLEAHLKPNCFVPVAVASTINAVGTRTPGTKPERALVA